MSTKYDDVNAKCPYFRTSGKRDVICEGITDKCTTVIRFKSEKDRDRHREIFCNAKCEYCEVYQMLEQKYMD